MVELVRWEDSWLSDWRDLLGVLAPYYDCARRLGLEPRSFFAEAAAAGPASIADIVRRLGERPARDVKPKSWDFEVVDGPDGPTYRRPGR